MRQFGESLLGYTGGVIGRRVAQRVRRALRLQPITNPQDVMVFTHHLIVFTMRAEIEGWSREKFIYMNDPQHKDRRPPNASLTLYHGVPDDNGGKLVLDPRVIQKQLYTNEEVEDALRLAS